MPMNPDIRRFGTLALLAVVWLLSTVYAIRLGGEILDIDFDRQAEGAGLAMSGSAEVQQALACTLNVDTVTYEPTFETPFRRRGARVSRGGPRRPSYSRKKLHLKGVLLKKNPLAILEAEDGSTEILGLGGTIDGQRVMRIREDRVTLRDRHGSYELRVQQ